MRFVTGMQADTTLIGRHADRAFAMNLFQLTAGPQHFARLLRFFPHENFPTLPGPIDSSKQSEMPLKCNAAFNTLEKQPTLTS